MVKVRALEKWSGKGEGKRTWEEEQGGTTWKMRQFCRRKSRS